MPFEKDPNEIGALWIKQGPKGEYLTGVINSGQRIVAFRNTKKTSDKSPDYRILKSVPKGETPGRPAHNANANNVDDDSIPF